MGRSAEAHYDTMSIAAICTNAGGPSGPADSAILFLWVTKLAFGCIIAASSAVAITPRP